VRGHAVEWYDFAIFGALAATLSRVFFPSAGLAGGVRRRPTPLGLIGHHIRRRLPRAG
jgi:hypothetical protein